MFSYVHSMCAIEKRGVIVDCDLLLKFYKLWL